jgi:hypothetical protein
MKEVGKDKEPEEVYYDGGSDYYMAVFRIYKECERCGAKETDTEKRPTQVREWIVMAEGNPKSDSPMDRRLGRPLSGKR